MPSAEYRTPIYLIISLCAPCCPRLQSLDFLKDQVDFPFSGVVIIGASGKEGAEKTVRGMTMGLGIPEVPWHTNNRPF